MAGARLGSGVGSPHIVPKFRDQRKRRLPMSQDQSPDKAPEQDAPAESEDTEGQKLGFPRVTDDEDTEGQKLGFPRVTGDDDTEGHKLGFPRVTDDDDTEGHKA